MTAGLWIGGLERKPSPVMTEEDLITDQEMLRAAPPDILLTNYKMLDYLLVRPRDFPLWRLNEPETLRYLVVDELHTFDGAQGADLACLIRRIKERVKTPPEQLCCVGTSATLGEGSQEDLAAYARQLFGEPFDKDSVIGESLLTPDEFLKGYLVTRFQTPGAGDWERWTRWHMSQRKQYLKAQAQLWMGEDLAPDPVALAEALKHHAFFRNLLMILGQPCRRCRRLVSRTKETDSRLRHIGGQLSRPSARQLSCVGVSRQGFGSCHRRQSEVRSAGADSYAALAAGAAAHGGVGAKRPDAGLCR